MEIEVFRNLLANPKVTPLGDHELQIGDHVFNLEEFMIGGIIPDIAKNKNGSHFKVESRNAKGIMIPDLYPAKAELQKVESWSIRMGIYSHLYLDRHFLNQFLIPKFDWDLASDRVVRKKTQEVFTEKEFFSPEGLYKGYAEANWVLILGQQIDLNLIQTLPENPPLVGLPIYDERRERTWVEELDYYLVERTSCRNWVFPVNELIDFLREEARSFSAELLRGAE